MTAEPLFTVWATLDGRPCSPILCTTGQLATGLAVNLGAERIARDVVLVPCCQSDGCACIRDQFDDPEDEQATEILMLAAMARGITWPRDLGRDEPETSSLPAGAHDDRRR